MNSFLQEYSVSSFVAYLESVKTYKDFDDSVLILQAPGQADASQRMSFIFWSLVNNSSERAFVQPNNTNK